MRKNIDNKFRSLGAKAVLLTGAVVFITLCIWSVINYKGQKQAMLGSAAAGAYRFAQAAALSLQPAALNADIPEISRILSEIDKQPGIAFCIFYDRNGEPISAGLKSRRSARKINPDETLRSRRTVDPSRPFLYEYKIIDIHPSGSVLSTTVPVLSKNKKLLGFLEAAVSLNDVYIAGTITAGRSIVIGLFTVFAACFALGLFFLTSVAKPLERATDGVRSLAENSRFSRLDARGNDEIGRLTRTINNRARIIAEQKDELKAQRDEYREFFESVPCIITVQDRDMRLLNYNRMFAEKFKPSRGDYCFQAYKHLNAKCLNCPVEMTFNDGLCHYSEEMAIRSDGTPVYWAVHTSPLFDKEGKIFAAMEICLDITPRKQLEDELQKSEKKYYAIFNNIPNPVFVLDVDTLAILDCNERVQAVYGYSKSEMMERSFLELFADQEREQYEAVIKNTAVINTARHMHKDGDMIYVNVRISPCEYPGQKVYLVTTSDITKRLETEQQLIQAGKMATLGEMATGVAHELNQPLTVIKTAGAFFMKKLNKKERIPEDILYSFAEEIDQHVDRASKIINHMREFGRKSDPYHDSVDVNTVLQKAFELFSRQLILRKIEVLWNLEENLPPIKAEANRLEQVFINLLVNARDAIEAQWSRAARGDGKKITLETTSVGDKVMVRVEDNGTGIPNAISRKIFEPFFTTKGVGKGTGLGLSISYGFVKECNGDIRTEPGAEGGVSFILEFPVYNEATLENQD